MIQIFNLNTYIKMIYGLEEKILYTYILELVHIIYVYNEITMPKSYSGI